MAKLGTFTVGASSVTMTRGRGANRTVALEVSFKELEKWASVNKAKTPKLIRQSFKGAVNGLTGKFREIMRKGGGINNVPKFKDFEDFTKSLREVRGISRRRMGGKLAEKQSITAFKRGGWQYIGWPDRLHEWSAKFQEATGNNDLSNNRFRHWLHSRGIHDIPHSYTHNPREVVKPFQKYVDQNLKKWARDILMKTLARQYAKRQLAK